MWEWFDRYVILFIVWFLLVFLKKTKAKKGDFDLFLFVVALAAYVIFHRLALAELPLEYLELFYFAGFLYTLLMFDIKALFRRDMTREKLKSLQKEHEELKDRSELLRRRFIAMLDLVDEGIVFRTDDNRMFGTEKMLSVTGMDDHEFSYEEFLSHLHSDDRRAYEEAISKCSKKKPEYQTHYRVKKDGVYEWVKENGMRMDYDRRTMYIAIVRGVNVRRYPKTDVDMLNRLNIDQSLLEALQKYNRNREPYSLVLFELANIPRINENYGRDIGDLMMGKFLNKLVYHFLRDADVVFRLSGIRFAMIIHDHRKYEMLKRALEQGGELVNFSMSFGEVKESVYPYFGIQHIDYFDEPVDEILSRGHKALNIALDDNTPENYFIIK